MGRLLKFWAALALAFFTAGHCHAQFDQNDMAKDLAEALTFTKYPTYPQYVEMMQYFAENYPEICRVDTFGTSVEGRLLLAVKISDNVSLDEAEAAFLYTSSMHGNELMGYPMMLRLISYLLTGYGEDSEVDRLVDGLEIWINPLANPDGTFHGGDHTVLDANRLNANGIDLNRNFPDISKAEPDNESARAKENQHMMRFLREQRFTLSANIHSGAEVVNYPWDWTYDRHPDDQWFQFISREYADEVHAVAPHYLTMEDNGITNGANWYVVRGSRQDYVCHFLGGREVTLELAYDFLMDSDSLDSFWLKNERSLLYYITQATYGIRGQVRGGPDELPIKAKVSIAGHDDSTSVVYSNADHGDFYRLIKAGTYDVSFSAEGYQTKTLAGVEVDDYQANYLKVHLDSLMDSTNPFPFTEQFSLYPNPVENKLFIEISERVSSPLNMIIYSSDGRIQFAQSIRTTSSRIVLPVEGLENGLFFIKIISANRMATFKFVKQ